MESPKGLEAEDNLIMKLKFDSNLEYQLEAIQSVTDLFEGLPPRQSEFEISFGRQSGMLFNELGVGNQLLLNQDQLLRNLHTIQERNTIPKSRFLVEYDDTYRFSNFSVEMETGTGKTYVYLRTLFELFYGTLLTMLNNFTFKNGGKGAGGSTLEIQKFYNSIYGQDIIFQ